MTAFSTIAGMTPLVLGLGAGAETRAPMGTCVVGGMLTSTLLTLIVVPVMYSLIDDIGLFVKRIVFRSHDDQADQADPDELAQRAPDSTSNAQVDTVTAKAS
jgi:HAE1 family hydrophobic/amphiphilic exporter-1